MWCSRYLFSIWHWVAQKINWCTTNNNLDELSDHEPDDTDRLVEPVFDTDRLVEPVFDKQVIIELLYEYDD